MRPLTNKTNSIDKSSIKSERKQSQADTLFVFAAHFRQFQVSDLWHIVFDNKALHYSLSSKDLNIEIIIESKRIGR
jgi:hypothetical protein